jgi:hypothetical protein
MASEAFMALGGLEQGCLVQLLVESISSKNNEMRAHNITSAIDICLQCVKLLRSGLLGERHHRRE